MMQACVIAMSLLIPQVFGANLPSPNATASPIPMPEDFTGYQVGIWAREQRNRHTSGQINKQTNKQTREQTKTSGQINKQTDKKTNKQTNNKKKLVDK